MERKSRADIDGYRQVRNIPTPVAQGLYEVTCKEIDDGIPSLTQPIMLRGLIHKPYNHGNTWKIRTRGAEIMIKWFMDCIPPDVVEGKRYCILGNLLTANLGAKFIVDDCVLIRDYTACRNSLKAFYLQFVLPLHEYVEKPASDTYFVKE